VAVRKQTASTETSDSPAAKRRPQAAHVWLFYAMEGQAATAWAGEMRPHEIRFWRHNSVAYTKQLAVGDSVVVMIGSTSRGGGTPGGRIIATGILAADASIRFTDTRQKVRRWPVLCIDAFQSKPIDRHKIEEIAGPLVRNEGAIHSLTPEAVAAINTRLSERGATRVPVSVDEAQQAFSHSEPIQKALERDSYMQVEEGVLSALPWPPEISRRGIQEDWAEEGHTRDRARVLLSFAPRDTVLAPNEPEPRKNQIILWPAGQLFPDNAPSESFQLTPGDVVLGVLEPPGRDASVSLRNFERPLHVDLIGVVQTVEQIGVQHDSRHKVPIVVTEVSFHLEFTPSELMKVSSEQLKRSQHLRAIALSQDDVDAVNIWLSGNRRREIPYDSEYLTRLFREAEDSRESAPLEAQLEEDERVQPAELDAYVPFRGDAPSEIEDALDRGLLAFFLGRRLHLIWCEMNGFAPGVSAEAARPNPTPKQRSDKSASGEADTFIVHIDSPWGGGKTTFANFVARVLDPRNKPLTERHFLRPVVAPLASPDELAATKLDEIFFLDPHRNEAERNRWPEEARKPWIIANYNAWRDQYVQPPWWHVFLTIDVALCKELRAEVRHGVSRFFKVGWREKISVAGQVWSSFRRWLLIRLERLFYQVWNAKFRDQFTLLVLAALLFFIIWQTGLVTKILEGSGTETLSKVVKDRIDATVAILGLVGVSVAAFLKVISQSLTPDLDFTAEHKQIGVRDPIGRFRNAFKRILKHAARPVLLIVDDIDRCEPRAVVEILRGFQTIVRSPRLFVLVLGDRSWIEKAHEIYHKDFAGITVGTESRLGERFVEKMFQLSFTLPAMKPEVRERFTRAVLEGVLEGRANRESNSGTVLAATAGGGGATDMRVPPSAVRSREQGDVLRELEHKVGEAIDKFATVEKREEQVNLAKLEAVERGAEKAHVDALANTKLVAAAASDPGYERQVANVLFELAASLPNNPRQIKRIINAFAVYETVGRFYFDYQLGTDKTADNGEVGARRWRQLAIWVTLATEWPDTWRALARESRLIDAAYADDLAERSSIRQALLEGLLGEEARKKAEAIIHRLTHDHLLLRLLGVDRGEQARVADADQSVDDSGLFAQTRMEAAAIFEFNRIMWEPGFPMNAATTAPASVA
jgi:KAP-like P-loop domain-containing protein